MNKFVKIIIDKKNKKYRNIDYLPKVILLYQRFAKYLHDDYCPKKFDSIESLVINLVERTSPYFWVVVDKKTSAFAGFVFLDTFVGSFDSLHSAEVTTCFEPKYWGLYTRICAAKFLSYCFKNYKLKKIKANVFPQNFKVKGFLKKLGFKKEALLKGETLKNSQMQDIEVYSIFNEKIKKKKR